MSHRHRPSLVLRINQNVHRSLYSKFGAREGERGGGRERPRERERETETEAETERELAGTLSPVKHRGLHQGWTQTSLYLQFIYFTSHHTTSRVFFSLFIFRGHSTREPASGRVYFICCGPTKELCVSHSQHRKNRERFGKKCRWMDQKGRDKQGRNPWQ